MEGLALGKRRRGDRIFGYIPPFNSLSKQRSKDVSVLAMGWPNHHGVTKSGGTN